jgi:hypothetical protein
MAPTTAQLLIRCSEETFRRFKRYQAENGFRRAEDALKFLLDQAESLKLRPGSGYR